MAQTTVVPSGTAPSDLTGTVSAPKGPAEGPSLNKLDVNSLNAAASAGGQWQTGNSKIFAGTATGKFELRRGADDFGASLVGNYAETFVSTAAVPATATMPATPATGEWKRSTENFQGKLRYERYLLPITSAFVGVTGTHDRFIALTFRFNVDPGVKVLMIENAATELWAEAGYDFQYDDNYTDSNGIEQAGAGGPVVDSSGNPFVISKSDTIHSSRLFVGLHEAFNKDVTLGLGVEYLQGFGGSGGSPPELVAIPTPYTAVDPVSISLKAARVNFNALFAANIGGGFSVGFGFMAKFNSQPLPGKVDWDTQGTIALIYALSLPSPKPAPPPCPTPPPAPPPPPPPPAATPASSSPSTAPAPTTPGYAAPAPAAPPIVPPPTPAPAATTPTSAPPPPSAPAH
ncbi:MAG TPA: DUF481 domain-containing protein [Polyangiaceae bacterium]|nr:DUF481 domain-containing protein [Polyangiaceae bacterium]